MTRSMLAGVFPDFGATSAELGQIVGALITVVLFTAVLTLLACAAAWAIASSAGNHQSAANARTGLLVALGVTALAGAAAIWMNFLIRLGDAM